MKNPFKRKPALQTPVSGEAGQPAPTSHTENAIAQLQTSLGNLSRELGNRSMAIAQLQNEAEDLGRVYHAMTAALDILDPKQADAPTVDEDGAHLKRGKAKP